MKKWVPITIAGLLVLLQLTNVIMKKQLKNKINNPLFINKLKSLDNSNTQKNSLFTEIGTSDSTNVYIDYKYSFKIIFPKGWEIKKGISNENIIIKAIHRLEDHRFATIIIYAWEIENSFNFDSLTPEDLFNLTYSDLADLISSGTGKLSDNKLIWLKMRITDFGLPNYAILYSFVKNNTFFSLFGNTVMGDSTWFKQNEKKFVKSFKTFKFIKQ